MTAGSVFCVNKVSSELGQINLLDRLSDRVNRDQLPTALLFEFNNSSCDCIERIIPGHSYVGAWMKASAALSDQDIAGSDVFAAVLLNTKALGLAIAPVSCRTCPFFMCHDKSPLICVLASVFVETTQLVSLLAVLRPLSALLPCLWILL